MKLLISEEWLRARIAADPDIPTDAGTAMIVLEGLGALVPRESSDSDKEDQRVVKLRIALGVLVRQTRQKKKLSVAQLAKLAIVEETEIRGIEQDPHFRVRPRTLHKLATHLSLPSRQLMLLSGATKSIDRGLYNHAVRFAARADDFGTLDKEEQNILFSFVAYLNERQDKE